MPILFLFADSFPDRNRKGITIIEGSDVSIWISSSVVRGNTVSKSPMIGDIANPGSDVMADIDHIAKSANIDISALPVVIFFITIVLPYSFTMNRTDKYYFCWNKYTW